MSGLWKRLRKRKRLDRDLEDELRFHLEMKTQETGDGGEARRCFGNMAALKETCRDLWTFRAIESWWKDLRYGVRSLWKSRGVTASAIAALALGIGADTTVFTIVHAGLSYDVGIKDLDRVVLVQATDVQRRESFFQSYPDARELISKIRSLQDITAYRLDPVNVSDSSGLPERYSGVWMSASGFRLIDRQPALGRIFGPQDELPGATPVVVLAYRVWQDRFGKDRSVIGKTIRVNGAPRTIVGVMPLGVRFPEDAVLWMPLPLTQLQNRNVVVFARLASGYKPQAATAELESLAQSALAQTPGAAKGLTFQLTTIRQVYGVYAARPLFLIVFCAVGFVLLIACADVANLLLSRAATRSREISIRIAIGAGRARIIRQLLIESVLLSVMGGFFGWLIALASLDWFDAATSKFPRPAWVDLSMNVDVFAYVAAISIGAGILFGLAPALRLSKIDVNSAVKDGGYTAAGAVRGRRLANLLTAFQMGLCVILLAGAGLMIRSSIVLYSAPTGVNPVNVLTTQIFLPETKYARTEDQVAYHQRLKERLESLPGVESAAVMSNLPTWGFMGIAYEPEQTASAPSGGFAESGAVIVSPDYFRVMQVRPLRGRIFNDDPSSFEVVVNEKLALDFFPGQDPLGKRLRLLSGQQTPWLTIAGVVPDIQQNFQRPLERTPLLYLPYSLAPQRMAFIAARTRVPPETLAAALRHEVQTLDQDLPLFDVRTLESRIAQNRLNVGAVGVVLTLFAIVALALASVGLYGVIAYSVNQRTREIGVRMAMGGSTGDILWLIFSQGLRPVAWGLVAGMPAAFGLTRVLRSMLVGVSPGDAVTFAGVVAALIVAGALGCAVPARRAVRVDPLAALRSD